jgi:hypothetical protein
MSLLQITDIEEKPSAWVPGSDLCSRGLEDRYQAGLMSGKPPSEHRVAQVHNFAASNYLDRSGDVHSTADQNFWQFAQVDCSLFP